MDGTVRCRERGLSGNGAVAPPVRCGLGLPRRGRCAGCPGPSMVLSAGPSTEVSAVDGSVGGPKSITCRTDSPPGRAIRKCRSFKTGASGPASPVGPPGMQGPDTETARPRESFVHATVRRGPHTSCGPSPGADRLVVCLSTVNLAAPRTRVPSEDSRRRGYLAGLSGGTGGRPRDFPRSEGDRHAPCRYRPSPRQNCSRGPFLHGSEPRHGPDVTQLSQRPLWGSEHRETGGTTPLPAELCEAVAALGDAICAATDCFCLAPASGDSNWFEVSGSSRGVALGR